MRDAVFVFMIEVKGVDRCLEFCCACACLSSPKMFPMTSLREEAWHQHACFVDAQLFTSCRGFLLGC